MVSELPNEDYGVYRTHNGTQLFGRHVEQLRVPRSVRQCRLQTILQRRELQ